MNVGRAMRIATVTSCLTVFGTLRWYSMTDRIAPPKEAGPAAVAAKIVGEEVLYTPIYNSIYLIFVPVVLGHGLGAGLASWKARFKVCAPVGSNEDAPLSFI